MSFSAIIRTGLKRNSLTITNSAPIQRSLATMVKAHRFVYAKKFEGEPKLTDFTLEEEELPALNEGGM